MSIVGPRPLLVRYLDRYNEEQHHRHDDRPGLTGYSRLFSIVGNLKLFINSPIWGNGIQSVDTRLFSYYLSKNGIGETIHWERIRPP